MSTEDPDPEILALVLKVEQEAREAGERRDTLAAAIEVIAEQFAVLAERRDVWPVADDSPASFDNRIALIPVGNGDESLSEVIRSEITINLLAATDQLRGLSVLIRAERSMIGAGVLARGVFESSVWAAALMDPAIDPVDRLKRALTRRVARLSAGIRIDGFLGDDPVRSQNTDAAQQQIEKIVLLAEALGWKVTRRKRGIEFDEPLTVNWLIENLNTTMGLEGYSWTTGSALAHGEHAAQTASAVAMFQGAGFVPAWRIRFESTGAWAGVRLLLATFARYTGHVTLLDEFKAFEIAFWEVGIR